MVTKFSASQRKLISPGERNGRLTAVEFVERDRWGAARWRFRCECGNINYVARPDQVRRGIIISCGCLREEKAATRCRLRAKHGHSRRGSRSSEYHSWRNMLDRCRDPNSDSYKWYGGRGITVCDRWLTFENFLADMGLKPAPKCTIGRINNDRRYEPDNCRWESPKQQARNRVTSRLVLYRDRSITIAEACEITGISRNVVDGRLNRGWTPERAVTTAVKLYRERSS